MRPLNVLSLFDGISCGRVALERAEIPVNKYFASEIDKYAIQITQKNYPDTIQIGDVTKVDWTPFAGKIDLLIGGSPCQDLSIAKNGRKGLDGVRSGLFWNYVEALNTINPKYFLLENVASMSKKDKDLITSILKVEPILIDSSLLSAQQRKRLYWTNIPNITQPKDLGIYIKDIKEDDIDNRLSKYYVNIPSKNIKIEPVNIRTLKNIRKDCEKVKTLTSSMYKGGASNGMTNITIKINKPIRLGSINKGGQGDRIYSIQGKTVSLSANGGGRGAKTGLYVIDLPDGDYIIRKLTPLECERAQTLPDNYTFGISDTQRYKSIGNGWTVDVIAYILKFLRTDLEGDNK